MTQELMTIAERITLYAADKDLSVEKLQKLMELYEANEKNIAKQRFNADYVAMKPHLPAIIKENKNSQTSSYYASLDNINKIIDPILAEHGFATSFKIFNQNEKTVSVRAELIHKDGYTDSTEITLNLDTSGLKGNANKTEIQGTASSITYCKRIALCALLNITTENDKDTDGEQFITTEQAESLRQRVEAMNGVEKFLNTFKIKSFETINAKDYARLDKAVQIAEGQHNASI